AATGAHVCRLTVSGGAASATDDVTIDVTGGGGGGAQTAVFDATLRAPKCAAVGSSCDTGPSLVLGRGTVGPEPNPPNTINGTCADRGSGAIHLDESNDRQVVAAPDGADLAPRDTLTRTAN